MSSHENGFLGHKQNSSTESNVVDFDSRRKLELLNKDKLTFSEQIKNDFDSILEREADGLHEYLLHNKRIRTSALERGMPTNQGVDVEKLERDIPFLIERRTHMREDLLDMVRQAHSQEVLEQSQAQYQSEKIKMESEIAQLEGLVIQARDFK